jgi:hypothetical protein
MDLAGVKFNIDLDFPAVILMLIFLLGLYVLWKTQNADNDFDFSDMLRDDSGKPSSSRLAVFVCLAVSTWSIMYMLVTTKGVIDTWIFVAYVAIWSGAKVAERGIDAYLNKTGLPNGNGGVVPVPMPAPRSKPRPAPRKADDSDEDEPAH